MRICLVIEAGGGGAGRHVTDLASHLSRRGHDVHLIYSAVRAEPRFLAEIAALPGTSEAIDMHRALGLHDLHSMRALARAIAAAGPFDIVHGHSSKAGALVRCAPVGGARRIYTPHAFRGLDPSASLSARLIYNGAEIALGVRTDALIAVSREELAFAERLHIAEGRRHLIRNGVVDVPELDPVAARRTLGLDEASIVFGFVGRLSYQKAPERFIEAMTRVMHRVPTARAVILGDGENADTVDQLLDASGLRDRFVWQRQSKAQELMPAFNAIVMSSRYEGLSYVLLESLAAGVPIVTTDVAGAADVIDDSGCGVIVPNDDRVIERLEETAMLLCTDDATRAAMSAAAVRRGAQLNGLRMIDETEQLYRQVIGEQRA